MMKLLVLTLYGTVVAWVSKQGHYLSGFKPNVTTWRLKKENEPRAKRGVMATPLFKEFGKTWFQLQQNQNQKNSGAVTTGTTLLY